MPGVTLVAHADWSVSDKKRWVARAPAEGLMGVLKQPLQLRRNLPGLLLQRLKAEAGEGGCAVAGFDFPIGLPVAYARKAGIGDFQEFLLNWGEGRWADFDKPARLSGEICVERPFYPLAPGGSQRIFLIGGLGISWRGPLSKVRARA